MKTITYMVNYFTLEEIKERMSQNDFNKILYRLSADDMELLEFNVHDFECRVNEEYPFLEWSKNIEYSFNPYCVDRVRIIGELDTNELLSYLFSNEYIDEKMYKRLKFILYHYGIEITNKSYSGFRNKYTVDADIFGLNGYNLLANALDTLENMVNNLVNDIKNRIRKDIQEEIDHHLTEEYWKEITEANGWMFTENGDVIYNISGEII